MFRLSVEAGEINLHFILASDDTRIIIVSSNNGVCEDSVAAVDLQVHKDTKFMEELKN